YEYDLREVIKHEHCFVGHDGGRDYKRKHVYTKADYLSVSKQWLNLEDPQLRKMYGVLEKRMSLQSLRNSLESLWTDIANDIEPSDYTIPEHLINGLGDQEKAIELFNYYLSRLPKYRFRGEPTYEIAHDFGPIERKVYKKHDPCPCGSGIKYASCCLNQKKLLKNEAILTRTDSEVIYFLIHDILYFTNQKIAMFDTEIAREEFIDSLPQEDFHRLKTHVFEHVEYIEQYMAEHFEDYPPEILHALDLFRRAKTGHFVAIEYRDQKLVVLSSDEKHAYVLTGLVSPLSELISVDRLPKFIDITLIPFKNRIIYPIDFAEIPITLGPGIRKRIEKIMEGIEIETTF
ncbi:MAG: SEC-C domain-containing protein, partial [Acholeplasmataceae bacterium]